MHRLATSKKVLFDLGTIVGNEGLVVCLLYPNSRRMLWISRSMGNGLRT